MIYEHQINELMNQPRHIRRKQPDLVSVFQSLSAPLCKRCMKKHSKAEACR